MPCIVYFVHTKYIITNLYYCTPMIWLLRCCVQHHSLSKLKGPPSLINFTSPAHSLWLTLSKQTSFSKSKTSLSSCQTPNLWLLLLCILYFYNFNLTTSNCTQLAKVYAKTTSMQCTMHCADFVNKYVLWPRPNQHYLTLYSHWSLGSNKAFQQTFNTE